MAYKFQRGKAILSGSIVAEEGFDANQQEVEGVNTISNSGNEITIVENTKLNGTSELRFNAAGNRINKGSGDSLEFRAAGTKVFEIGQTQLDAEANLRMSGSTKVQFAGPDDSIGINGGNLEVKGDVDVDLVAGGVVAVKSNALVDTDKQIRFRSADLKIHSPSANTLSLEGASGDDVRIEVASGATLKVSTDVSSSANIQGGGDLTIKGNAVLNGNVDLGNATTDTVTVTGRFDSDLQPSTDNARDLGSSSNRWQDLFLAGTASIAGDLIVLGTSTRIDSTLIEVTGGISFEGTTANGAETRLTVIDPTADRDISLPDLSANATLAAFSDASFAASNITPSPITLTELNNLDGGTSVGTTAVAGGHGILMNHGGTMAQTSVDTLLAYVNSNVAVQETVQSGSANVTLNLSNGAIFLAQSASSAYTITLPAAASAQGRLIKIKREDGADVTIAASGSQKIDDDGSIILESDYAAVTLFSNGANYFII